MKVHHQRMIAIPVIATLQITSGVLFMLQSGLFYPTIVTPLANQRRILDHFLGSISILDLAPLSLTSHPHMFNRLVQLATLLIVACISCGQARAFLISSTWYIVFDIALIDILSMLDGKASNERCFIGLIYEFDEGVIFCCMPAAEVYVPKDATKAINRC